jgi:FMN-dependent oxidoreductase (nitrilotriacetate monooxygenase family)
MTDSATPSDPSNHLHFFLLDGAAIGHNNYGLWTHPQNQKKNIHSIAYWKNLAREAEAAKLDAIFLADVLGLTAGYQGSTDVALREGFGAPALDPAIVVATMLDSTEHLGFGITVSATYDPPFSTARKLATLDHLSNGRIGWNVVMSFLPNANENHGLALDSLTSAERYERANDFLEVCYKLWEESWEDDALIADTASQILTDPSRVHRIDHVGPYYRSAGPSLLDPSPQRTPLIFQAGQSDHGREFGAKHAEVAFIDPYTADSMSLAVKDIRARAARVGRSQKEVLVTPVANIIVSETKDEARAKLAEFQRFTKPDGYLTHHAWGRFNILAHPRTQLFDDALVEDGLSRDDSGVYGHGPDATVGDVIDAFADLRKGLFFVASDAAGVADAVEEWADSYDLSSFMLRSFLHPGTLQDFGRLVVPELQRRGRYRTEYDGSTLRENVFGPGHSRVADSHPAASHRRPLGGGSE